MNIYIGNLSYETRDSDLQGAFSAFGSVQNAKVIMDADTGRSKGFGFVEMSSNSEGELAIKEMNGDARWGRPLTVNEARPKGEKSFGKSARGGRDSGNGDRFNRY